MRRGDNPELSRWALNAITRVPNVTFKKEAERSLIQTEEKERHTQKKRQREDEGRDCSNAATRHGIVTATRTWKRQGTDSHLEHLEGRWPCQHLDFSTVILTSDFWPPTSERINYHSLSHQVCDNLLQP